MIVSILLDALIVLAAILGIIIGLKRGFVKMFLLRFRKVAAAVLAIFLAKPLGAFVTKYFLADKLSDWVLSLAGVADVPAESPEALLSSTPWLMRSIADLFHYDLNALAERAYANGEGMQKALVSELSYPLASFIAVVLSWTIVFFILLFAIKILSGMIEDVFELPILKQVNALCGAFVCLVMNAAIIWLFCQLLGWLLTTDVFSSLSFMQGFSMENTFIAKYIYHFNPLAFIFSVNPK